MLWCSRCRGETLEWCLSGTTGKGAASGNGAPGSTHPNSYLPGRGDTMIWKVVHPGRGPAIALRLADPCEFPKCGNLDCIIYGSGGLRSRSPLIHLWKKMRLCGPNGCPAEKCGLLPAVHVLVALWLLLFVSFQPQTSVAVTESAARRSVWVQAMCLSRHSYSEGGNGRRGLLQGTE